MLKRMGNRTFVSTDRLWTFIKKESIRTFITRPVIYLGLSVLWGAPHLTTNDQLVQRSSSLRGEIAWSCTNHEHSWQNSDSTKKHLAKSTCSPSLSGNFWCVWFQNNKVAYSYGYSVWNQLYLLVHLPLLTDFDFGCIGCSMIVIV